MRDDEFSLRTIVIALRWNARPFAVILLLCWTFAALAVWVTPNSYEASTQVLLEPLPRKPVSVALDGLADPLDSAQADSRLQVVRSERLLRFVFEAIDWPRVSGFSLNRQADKSHPNLWARLRSFLKPGSSDENARETQALLDFMDRVSVKRLGLSYVIEITFRAKSARQAATVVNSITAAYLRSLVIASEYDGELLQRRVANVEQEKQTLLNAVKTGTIPDQNFSDANARVISAALEPLSRSSPKTSLIVAFATSIALVCGLLMSLVRYRGDRTIRTGREGFIPSSLRLLGTLPTVREQTAQRVGAIACTQVPISPLLMQEILRPRERGRCNVVGFVAAQAGTGTSHVTRTICANMRANQIQAKLVEVSAKLSSSNAPDDASVKRTTAKLGGQDSALQADEELSFATLVNPLKMKAVLKTLGNEGPVLVDLPATSSSFNALAVTPFVDLIVLVTKAEKTTAQDLSLLFRALPGAKTAGLLVNRLGILEANPPALKAAGRQQFNDRSIVDARRSVDANTAAA